MRLKVTLLMVGVFLVAGCGLLDGNDSSLEAGRPVSLATAIPLPTIYPTGTPHPTPESTSTKLPVPTGVPETPIAFDQEVVDLRYTIPGLGLDRRIRGNVASQIEVFDAESNHREVRSNQVGVLLELQQSLPEIELATVPEGCDMCVQISYSLPFANSTGSGWLQDTRILASLENYTAAVLGPHFPPGTIVGLRRSATPYQIAHTIALSADGRLWRWTAIEAEIDNPMPLTSETIQPLIGAVEVLDFTGIPEALISECPYGPGLETLFLNISGEEHIFQISCPELTLPGKLLAIYSWLDAAIEDKIADSGLPSPEPPVTLDTLIHYATADEKRLTVLANGLAIAVDGDGITYSGTVTSTLVVSITNKLLNSGQLQAGANVLVGQTWPNMLVVRSPDGVYQAGWEADQQDVMQPMLTELEALLKSIIDAGDQAAELETTVTPMTLATPSMTPGP